MYGTATEVAPDQYSARRQSPNGVYAISLNAIIRVRGAKSTNGYCKVSPDHLLISGDSSVRGNSF